MNHVRSLALFLVALGVLHACGKSGSGPGSTGQDGDSAAESGDAGASGESSGTGPLVMNEKRFHDYVAYRKEFHGLWKGFMQEWGQIAKSVDDKSNEASKAATALQGWTRLSEKQDVILKALRKKHGFGEEEDSRIWESVQAVASAKPMENPAIEPSLKMYRDMQARGGEEKKAADEFFASIESTEKETLEKAREDYGAECIDVLLKHVKELHALQVDAMEQMMGAHTPVR